MIRIILFSALGYVSGSVLYARLWARIFQKGDITKDSKDKNPGTANAFMYGGFCVGMLTLICELLKGFLPVVLYTRFSDKYFYDFRFALILCAPVIGHIFPVFYNFKGGKGIAVTFGSLLGLLPVFEPVFIMALSFIFYSLILKISPHYYRTVAAYLTTLLALGVFGIQQDMMSVCAGFTVITVAVGYRLFKSPEEKEKVRVGLLWMR